MNKKERQVIFDKYNGRCAYCGETITLKEMNVDHFLSQRNFEWHIKNNFKVPDFLKHLTILDVNHIDNLMPSCRVCNAWKTTFDIETFRSELQNQISRLNRDSSNFRIAKRYGLVEETPRTIQFYFESNEENTR